MVDGSSQAGGPAGGFPTFRENYITWLQLLTTLRLQDRPNGGPMQAEMPFLATKLSHSSQHPLVSIAHSIVSILKEVEGILRRSGALDALDSRTTTNDNGARSRPPNLLENHLNNAKSAAEGLSRHLQSAVPWRKRVKHDATPWRRSDRELLDENLRELGRWNDILYSILPHELRDSILQQAMSGLLLANPEEATYLADIGQGAISQQARLLQVHRRLAENVFPSSSVSNEARERLVSIDMTGIPADDGEPYSVVRASNGQQGKTFTLCMLR